MNCALEKAGAGWNSLKPGWGRLEQDWNKLELAGATLEPRWSQAGARLEDGPTPPLTGRQLFVAVSIRQSTSAPNEREQVVALPLSPHGVVQLRRLSSSQQSRYVISVKLKTKTPLDDFYRNLGTHCKFDFFDKMSCVRTARPYPASGVRWGEGVKWPPQASLPSAFQTGAVPVRCRQR